MSNGPQAMTDPWDWVSPGDNRFANNGAHSHLHQAQSAQQHRPNVGPNENFPAPPINSSMPQVPRQPQHYSQTYHDSSKPPVISQSGADFFDEIAPSRTNEPSHWVQQTPMWAPQSAVHPAPVISNRQPSGHQIEAENNEMAPPDVDYNRVPGFSSVVPDKNSNAFLEESRNVNNNNRVTQMSQGLPHHHYANSQADQNNPWINHNRDGPGTNHPASTTPSSLLQTVNSRSLMQNQYDAINQPNIEFSGNIPASSTAPNLTNAFHPGSTNVLTTEAVRSRSQALPRDPGTVSAGQNQRHHSNENGISIFNTAHHQAASLEQQQSNNVISLESQDVRSAIRNPSQSYLATHPSVEQARPSVVEFPIPGQAFQNQAVPPSQDAATEAKNHADINEANQIATNAQLFSTPDSRSTNPFISSMSMISVDTGMGMQPLGASTPTSMPFKPENEEVPSQQEILEHRMMNLNIEQTPQAAQLESEATNQEKPSVEKEVPLLVSDRNQYLETGQLSASKDNEESSVLELVEDAEGDTAPPPGLDRMVTGQLREPIATPSIDDIQSMHSNAPTVGSCHIGDSPTSSIVSGDGRKSGSIDGVEEDEAESQRLVQGESTTDDQPVSAYLAGPPSLREVPGEAEPVRGRVVLGQMGRSTSPPAIQDQLSPRNDRERKERDIVERMVVGERTEGPAQSNPQDDYRHRPRHRHPRGESSYEEEDRDYSSDRDRRDRDRGDFKRDDRPRRRRDDIHRSPEYRSDEEFPDKRGYPRGNRERDRRDRRERDREYSPDRDYYYRDYYHDPRDRRSKRFERERDYHHHREYDDDYYNYRDHHRSRPSSRSGSDYRRLNVSTEFANRSRHYYADTSMLLNSSIPTSIGGFPDFSKVDPREYSEYLETMRRVDPAGYAVWYNNYMATRYGVRQGSAHFSNDRASVHSGQSSSNQRQGAQSPPATADEEKEEDYTPRLYTTAHVRGKIDNYGRLLVIEPHYPMDGQQANISLYQLNGLPLPDADMEEFLETPGPFIPGITHRSTVLSCLKRMSQASEKSSETLLFDLIHLIVKGNGEINGCDVSELLMNSYKKSTQEEGRRESKGDGNVNLSEVTARFRELLIQGNQLEALEWVIENGAWGHALFLSSKMDVKTHKDVMFRFMDSVSRNDPIRTLYEMMSGHVPQASESCGDKNWSDWRPHLAIILGNPTANGKIDRKSIIRLGDSLSSKGRLFAAQFCYVTANVAVVAYEPNAKLVLLGANTKLDNPLLSSCRAILLTMCYEYGLKLKQPDFSIPSLQVYKLSLVVRLIDIGRNKLALQYCQMMALEALRCCNYDRSMMSLLVDLASRLKMMESSLALSGDVNEDPEWLEKLKNHYDSLPEDYEAKVELRPSVSSSTISEVSQDVQGEIPLLGNQARNQITVDQPLHDPCATYNPDLTVTSELPSKASVLQPPLFISDNLDYNSGSVINPPSVTTNPHLEMAPSSDIALNKSYYAQEPPNYWSNNNHSGGMVTLDNNVGNNAGNVYDYGGSSETHPNSTSRSTDFFKASEERLKVGSSKF
ncbi:unnamed protein product [Nesidiocoris tenuis]|uniref:Sec16 Sec23-binding domain-containing protein n=1 Tax=Nesidiocoris tenuis TaxID=355587 RepID=A0A6H5GS53_9HEMI|nr:unnamed protein product [Nesidiocoris tenuis]